MSNQSIANTRTPRVFVVLSFLVLCILCPVSFADDAASMEKQIIELIQAKEKAGLDTSDEQRMLADVRRIGQQKNELENRVKGRNTAISDLCSENNVLIADIAKVSLMKALLAEKGMSDACVSSYQRPENLNKLEYYCKKTQAFYKMLDEANVSFPNSEYADECKVAGYPW